jgi:hypothetical protein
VAVHFDMDVVPPERARAVLIVFFLLTFSLATSSLSSFPIPRILLHEVAPRSVIPLIFSLYSSRWRNLLHPLCVPRTLVLQGPGSGHHSRVSSNSSSSPTVSSHSSLGRPPQDSQAETPPASDRP